MKHVKEIKNHADRVKEATDYVHTRDLSKATYRLGFHLMAPSGWMNDPNGLIYFNNQYHVFYQHYPYDPTHGPMHWGHAVSDDLVHWNHLPIALAPGDHCDQSGCFSGSAVDDNGVLTLLYTGHNVINRERDEFYQNQNMARSMDGVRFDKSSQNPVIPKQPEGMQHHFRDPKVWKENGSWKMVVGSTEEGCGQVLLYQSDQLETWSYEGVLAKHNGENEGYMWECPDFFPLGDEHVLLLSPQGIEAEGDRYHNHHQTGYFVGHYQKNQFERGSFKELDYGHDFYAVQTFQDGKNRRIAIGWMDMWESPMPSQKEGWAGALTLPRELVLKNGHLYMKPVEELVALREKEIKLPSTNVANKWALPIKGQKIELVVTINLNQTKAEGFGLKLAQAEDGSEETVLFFDSNTKTVTLDRSQSGEGVTGKRTAPVSWNEQVRIQLFLDRSSIEVFLNDGETVLTSRIYPKETSIGAELFVLNGNVQLEESVGYLLKTVVT
ncbi:glycoside hydrolase family 32 protein [Shouchella miscanthi]|uniref:glycoside hydrolase family 32 protein n=1 Tax=Shouchella miscanthi TaxID=2598861 RepID=UPI001FE60CB8|nr:glycoside hydrolase family 32 protein [Shouchella miscanthi]